MENIEIEIVARAFIKTKCYATKLNLAQAKIEYLVNNGYIESNLQVVEYYFLNKKFYKEFFNILLTFNFTWVEMQLLEYCSPLKIIYFNGEFSHLFLNNPNFHFEWNGYRGYLYSSEQSKTDIYIKDLCLCHDLEENKIVLGVFICDLLTCSKESQALLLPYLLEYDEKRYEFHYCNYENLIEGKWIDYIDIDIYNVILEGLKIVNYIFTNKYGLKIFKKEYEIEELQFFMPLFFPTKVNRFNFLLEIYKIVIENLNLKNLKKLIRNQYEKMSNKNEFNKEDLKKDEFREFKAFKTYFKQYKTFNDKAFERLEVIRKLRTEPAHKIYLNDLKYNYCKEQDEILIDIYRVICNIIKVEDEKYKYVDEYDSGNYNCFYGRKGAISTRNGFNDAGYKYFNGYIKLINDKFNVRDAEILIFGNNLEQIKQKLINHIKTNIEAADADIDLIVNVIFQNNICIPNEKELKSFFYGMAYKMEFSGECKDYKKRGKEIFGEFKENKYKYVFVIADSTECYYDINKIIENFKRDKNSIFGSGFYIYSLTNNFSDDNTNILNIQGEKFININIWD